jgi:signal transduction histidine kinase
MSGPEGNGTELVEEIRALRTKLVELERAALQRYQYDEEILKLNEELENRVAERTASLKSAHEHLARDIQERKSLEQEILTVSEREKRLIGQELHDSIGQQFTGIACMTKVLERKLTGRLPDEAQRCVRILELVHKSMDQLRSLAKGLYPVNLKSGSLTASLSELADSTQELFNVRCQFKSDRALLIENTEAAVHVYRIAQEAITNAIKHGHAQNIEIELRHGSPESVLKIRNDGLDFSAPSSEYKGMGLRIMNHRAQMIKGSLDVCKSEPAGTVVTCIFPNTSV